MTGQSPLDAGYLTRRLGPREQQGTGATSPASTDSQDRSVGRALPAVLGIRDLTLFMVLIVVFVSNTNGVQFGGPAAFLYWVLGLITFLIPCAFVTRWLARRYPGQCAPYLWIGRILGPNWSFISAFCIWLPGVLAVVSVIDNGLIFIQFLLPTWFVTPVQQCLGIIVILVIATALTCLPLRWLKHLLGLFAILYLAVFALVGTAGLWWLESGHPAALALNAPAAWQPNAGNFPLYGVILLLISYFVYRPGVTEVPFCHGYHTNLLQSTFHIKVTGDICIGMFQVGIQYTSPKKYFGRIPPNFLTHASYVPISNCRDILHLAGIYFIDRSICLSHNPLPFRQPVKNFQTLRIFPQSSWLGDNLRKI